MENSHNNSIQVDKVKLRAIILTFTAELSKRCCTSNIREMCFNSKLSVSDYLAVYPLTSLGKAKASGTIGGNKQHAVFICVALSVPNSLKQITLF